jgi:hypothetical protein
MTNTVEVVSDLDQVREVVWQAFMNGRLTANAATVRLLHLDLAARQGRSLSPAPDTIGAMATPNGGPSTKAWARRS